MAKRHIEIDKAGPTVADVMMPQPHTNSGDESIADARTKLSKSSVKLLVVVDGERFTGTVGRDDLPAEDDGDLASIARDDGPRLAPDDSVEQALELHRTTGAERIPVVDPTASYAGSSASTAAPTTSAPSAGARARRRSPPALARELSPRGSSLSSPRYPERRKPPRSCSSSTLSAAARPR